MRLALRAAFAALLLATAACGVGQEDKTGAENASATSLESLLKIADATRAGGDMRTAVHLYRRANELYPEAPEPLVGLGGSMSEVGAHREAVQAYRQALALAPENTDALRGLGSAMIALNEADLALDQFNRLLEIDPLDYRALNGMGVALDSLGRHEEAQENYRAGLEIEPDDVSLRNNLGLSLAMNGHHQEAIAMLRELASEPDATPRTRQNLALALGLAGDMEAAAEISALDLTPEQVKENLAFISFVRERTKARTANAEHPAASAGGSAAEENEGSPQDGASQETTFGQPFLLMPGATSGNAHDSAADKAAATNETMEPLDKLEPSAGPAEAESLESGEPKPEAPMEEQAAPLAPDDGSPEAPQPASDLAEPSASSDGPAIFQIQLTAQKNVVLAYRAWRGLRGRFPEILADYHPSISVADLGTRGLFFRLRTNPPTTKGVAEASCEAMKARGSDCFVVKQEIDPQAGDTAVDTPS